MPSTEDALLIALVFLLAGTVKGVIGLGLPSVSLGLLTTFMGLPSAIALMLVGALEPEAGAGPGAGASARFRKGGRCTSACPCGA